MSHIVRIESRLHDPVAVAAACARLHLEAPTHGTAQLYAGEATGLIVQLPGWRYPAVINTLTGTVHFDDFAGAWGDRAQLERFLQAYAVERTKQEAKLKGYPFSEQTLEDGSIKVQIVEGR